MMDNQQHRAGLSLGDGGSALIPLALQIKEVQRELAMRASVYPGLVKAEKMTEGDAARHMAVMEAALHTLQILRIEGAALGRINDLIQKGV